MELHTCIAYTCTHVLPYTYIPYTVRHTYTIVDAICVNGSRMNGPGRRHLGEPLWP